MATTTDIRTDPTGSPHSGALRGFDDAPVAPPSGPPTTPPVAGPPPFGPPPLTAPTAWPPPSGPAPIVRVDRDRRRDRWRAALTGGVVGAVVASGVAYGTVRLTDDGPAVVTSAGAAQLADATSAGGAGSIATTDIHGLIDAVGPSVVAIEIGVAGRSGNVQQVAAGSGVVISNDGLVLTNAHVVDVTDRFGRPLANAVIQVKLADGSAREATLLGADASRDIAVIRVTDAAGLQAARLGDSDALRVGDDVVAIGNALDLGDTPSVTRGIVSAKGRELQVDATTTLTGLIQTDAPINHGNSGGALVNAAGEVVGINSAGIPDAQNVGFAIAINSVKPLIEQLAAGSTPSTSAGQPTAFLGVATQQTTSGVTVTGVTSGSAAASGGLQAGDVIVAIDGTEVPTTEEFGAVLAAKQPGDATRITFERNGATRTVTVELGARTR